MNKATPPTSTTLADSLYPQTVPDLEFDGVAGSETVVLGKPGALPLEVAGSVATLARLFDGRRSCAEIARHIEEQGAVLPGPDFVVALAQYLAGHGLVDLHDAATSDLPSADGMLALHSLNHECQRSGACCHDHLVEVDSGVAETLDADHQTLAKEFPRLLGVSPTREVEAGGRRVVALSLDAHRRCIYSDPQIGCLLHDRLGADRKPIACRMFPLQTIRTESEIRVGFSGACFGLCATYQSERHRSPAQITGFDPMDFPLPVSRGMDPEHPDDLERDADLSTSYGQHLAVEEELIRLTMRPDANLDELYRAVLQLGHGDAESVRGRSLSDASAMSGLGSVLPPFGASLSEAFGAGFLAAPQGSLLAGYSFITQLLTERAAGRPFLGLRSKERDFGFYVLREWLYLRDWHLQIDLATGMVVRLLGLVVASWVREDVEAGAKGLPDFASPFATGLTLWSRLVRTDTHFARLFERREQVRELVDLLRSA